MFCVLDDDDDVSSEGGEGLGKTDKKRKATKSKGSGLGVLDSSHSVPEDGFVFFSF